MPFNVSIWCQVEVDLLSFGLYMGRLMPTGSRVSSPSHKTPVKEVKEQKKDANKDHEEPAVIAPSGPIICDSQLFWINALIGRCFFDFLRDKWWIGKVTEKLQNKLKKIHVRHFLSVWSILNKKL